MKTSKKYKQDIKNFGEVESRGDVLKYFLSLCAINILVWGGIATILWFIAKKVL